MSLRRVGVLLRKESKSSASSFFLIFAVVTPIVLSLALSLVFGTIFAGTPKLAIVDAGDSQLIARASELDSVVTDQFETEADLKEAVSSGAADMGIVLPATFDEQVSRGETAEINAYIWGESLARNRVIIGVTIANLTRDLAGHEAPLEIVSTTLGDGENVPLNDRLLPLLILMAVVIGGTMIPASSLVDEKHKGTLTAVTMTPSTLEEVFLSKGLLGAAISLIMGVVILILNQAFGDQRLMLIAVLALGAILAAEFGVLLGALVKDITSLFATVKAIGILLYAPAFIYLFPGIPEWIGRIFPTYYIVQPVIDITRFGATWSDIIVEVAVLIGMIVALTVFMVALTRRLKYQLA